MEIKWMVGIVILIVVVLGLFVVFPAEKKEESGISGALAIAGLTCTTDSDCIFDSESDSCCANKNYVGTLGGACPTEGLYVFKGMCTCNIPEGWSEGQCNGLIRTEPISTNGNATPRRCVVSEDCFVYLCDCKCHQQGYEGPVCGIMDPNYCLDNFGIIGCDCVDGKCIEIKELE